MEAKRVLVDELTEKELVPGIFARFVHTDQVTIGYVRLLKGSVLPEHAHPHQQITSVMEGTLEMTLGGNTYTCEKGHSLVIPGNTPHSAVALTDCYVVDVFQPVREDYR